MRYAVLNWESMPRFRTNEDFSFLLEWWPLVTYWTREDGEEIGVDHEAFSIETWL